MRMQGLPRCRRRGLAILFIQPSHRMCTQIERNLIVYLIVINETPRLRPNEIASRRLVPRKSALASWDIRVELVGSVLRADRHADSACEGSIFLNAEAFRPSARELPSSGRLESCVHSTRDVCALPTCAERPAAMIAKETAEISVNARICVILRLCHFHASIVGPWRFA
jgi:hypothetical protein